MDRRIAWTVLICCLVPILGLGAIFFFKIPLAAAIYLGLLLLCPLAYFLLMAKMGNDQGSL